MSEPRRHGYIRVSTQVQLTDRQVDQLKAACDVFHVEKLSAVAAERPVFDALLAALVPGDTFVVVDLDRAFRSTIDAILTAQLLQDRGVRFHLLNFPIDTASDEGELFYTILAAFAQFERRIISRRTREGLAAARKRGVRLGRPRLLSPRDVKRAYKMLLTRRFSCRQIATCAGVSRITLQRAFHREGLRYPLHPQPKGANPCPSKPTTSKPRN